MHNGPAANSSSSFSLSGVFNVNAAVAAAAVKSCARCVLLGTKALSLTHSLIVSYLLSRSLCGPYSNWLSRIVVLVAAFLIT